MNQSEPISTVEHLQVVEKALSSIRPAVPPSTTNFACRQTVAAAGIERLRIKKLEFSRPGLPFSVALDYTKTVD
jgi:hypothetical protein